MCIANANMSEGGEEQLKALVSKDNAYFKALLDLVPPSAYFTAEEKNEILGNVASDDEDDDEAYYTWKRKHKKMKGVNNPLSTMSVSQITELRLKGETLVTVPSSHSKKFKKELNHNESSNGQGHSLVDDVEAKHKSKKQSRNAKALKNKGRELQKREARLEELQKRLKAKLEEMKARKNSGKPVTSQEQKRLRRQEKKVSLRLKNPNTFVKGMKNKEMKEKRMNIAEGLKSPPHKQILNENGDVVKSKYDFSMFSMGNDKSKSSNLHGKDYKRLLEQVEKRQEKVQELKEKDPEKGKKLEEKLAWQSMMSRAKGEKVKDDPKMLKKSLKKKEKMKEHRKKKWDERVKKVDESKDKRQQKRQGNLDKRRKDKDDKKRKKQIKKGRIIPGF